MADEQLISLLRRNGCYLEDGHYKLKNGKHSDTYIQARITLMDKEARREFAHRLVSQVMELAPTCVAASSVGGLLLASEIAELIGVPLLVGRELAKEVTWINFDEIAAKARQRVLLVDDVLTTGDTIGAATNALEGKMRSIVGVCVAVDRRQDSGQLAIGSLEFAIFAGVRLPLTVWDPSECPLADPYINLHNPEEDFLSVVLSMPPSLSDPILDGYREVFTLQRDQDQIGLLDQWRPWLPVLLAGLPSVRVGEDSGLVQFIHRFVARGEANPQRRRVLTEFVGHLMVVSQIRVEARPLGVSMLFGDRKQLADIFQARAPVALPANISPRSLDRLIPYYDALPETHSVFLFDKDGELFDVVRLVRSGDSSEIRGLQLLRQITGECDAIGFVVRRGRRSVAVYRSERLEAMADLSEKTGLWEFTTPRSVVEGTEWIIPGIGKTLEAVLEIAREMVNLGYGGLFVVGEIPASLTLKEPKIHVREQKLANLGPWIGAEIAKLDGAVFVTKLGAITRAATIIVNKVDESNSGGPSQPADRKPGGSRRETARRTSLECPESAVVCVSQNGTIDIWVRGQSRPVAEAVTGLGRS
jgi:orotate phosphoribosyltransferase